MTIKHPFKTEQVKEYALILASALLIVLSFPKVSWSFLMWIAFLPFSKAIENKSARRRFHLGYLLGIFYCLGVSYWLTHYMRHYGNLDLITSFSLLFLMALYFGLYGGAVAWLWGLNPFKGLLSLLWPPAIFSGLEFIRAYLVTGFPWTLVGHSQYNNLPIIQIAEITGVYGITFLIVLVNEILYRIFLADNSLRGWSRNWKGAVLTVFCLILTIWFGYRALALQKQKDHQGPLFEVGIIQGNIDQSLKWNPEFQQETLKIYNDLTRQTLSRTPDLVVWPETAVPFYFLNENLFTPKLFTFARETRSHFLFGSPAVVNQKGKQRYFNRAYLISPEGRQSYYDKVHLVPFGEYNPLKKLFPFAENLFQPTRDFSPGSGNYGLPHPKGKIGVLICFESIFPELSRALKKDDCRILVNITNDAWFGKTSAPYQHLAMLTFRAIENRIWIARSANGGFSAVIDATGRIIHRLSLFQSGGIYATIPLRTGQTFYSRHGDVLILGCLILFLAGIFLRIVKNPVLTHEISRRL